MALAYQASLSLSILLFLYYGWSCLSSDVLRAEFERFGVSRFRILTGTLEILGAVGLLVGQFLQPVLFLSAGGLTVMMALVVAMRVRLRDPITETLPALVLMLVNLFILVFALRAAAAL